MLAETIDKKGELFCCKASASVHDHVGLLIFFPSDVGHNPAQGVDLDTSHKSTFGSRAERNGQKILATLAPQEEKAINDVRRIGGESLSSK